MKTALISSIVLVAVVAVAFAQPPDTLWTHCFRDGDGSEARAVLARQSGGFVAGGICCGTFSHTFWYNLFIEGFDDSGNVLWEWGERPMGLISPGVRDIQPAFPSGFFAAGHYCQFGGSVNGDFGLFVARLGEQGDTVWTRLLSDVSGRGSAHGVLALTDGGCVLAGTYQRNLCRFDSSGNLLWIRDFSADFMGIEAANDGGYMCLGTVEGAGYDVFLFRLNEGGDSLWMRTYGGAVDEVAAAMDRTDDGGYVIAATAEWPDPRKRDIHVVRTDAQGDTLWTRMVGGSNDQYAADVLQTSDGGVVVAGSQRIGTASDYLAIKLDSAGDSLWTKVWGTDEDERLTAVDELPDSSLILAGAYYNTWCLIRLAAHPVPIQEHPSWAPSEYVLSVFPNPFNPTTTISFALPRAGRVTIAVYDLLGREVEMLTDATYPAGEHRIPFDGSHLPSGLYFARLQSGPFIATQKLLLLK